MNNPYPSKLTEQSKFLTGYVNVFSESRMSSINFVFFIVFESDNKEFASDHCFGITNLANGSVFLPPEDVGLLKPVVLDDNKDDDFIISHHPCYSFSLGK